MQTLWEGACSRWRCISQQMQCLVLNNREQAPSHIGIFAGFKSDIARYTLVDFCLARCVGTLAGIAPSPRWPLHRRATKLIAFQRRATMTTTIAGIKIPDSALAKATTEYIRDIESDLLYHHSRRVFLFGALSGERKQLAYNPELLYVGAMFHDLGLVEGYRSDNERFEVDGANAAAAFLKPYGLSDDDIEQVWLSIALHTTPGVPQHLRPTVALVTAGVEMDVLGMDYAAFSSVQREAVVHAHPRGEGFKECIICAFADGLRHRPQTTFGNVKTDVLVDQEPGFKPMNFVEVIRKSPWT
jgi:hypothetical protein